MCLEARRERRPTELDPAYTHHEPPSRRPTCTYSHPSTRTSRRGPARARARPVVAVCANGRSGKEAGPRRPCTHPLPPHAQPSATSALWLRVYILAVWGGEAAHAAEARRRRTRRREGHSAAGQQFGRYRVSTDTISTAVCDDMAVRRALARHGDHGAISRIRHPETSRSH